MESVTWRKSWRKSSRSGANGGNCVELARTPHHVDTRDSKAPGHGTLHFSPQAFSTLLKDIKQGKYDL
jgi:hypothetical protein